MRPPSTFPLVMQARLHAIAADRHVAPGAALVLAAIQKQPFAVGADLERAAPRRRNKPRADIPVRNQGRPPAPNLNTCAICSSKSASRSGEGTSIASARKCRSTASRRAMSDAARPKGKGLSGWSRRSAQSRLAASGKAARLLASAKRSIDRDGSKRRMTLLATSNASAPPEKR